MCMLVNLSETGPTFPLYVLQLKWDLSTIRPYFGVMKMFAKMKLNSKSV